MDFNNDSTVAPKVRRLSYLDALRGWAILLVLLLHASLGSSNLALSPWLKVVSYGGGTGVVLFFVLSAVSLTMSAKSCATFNIRAFALRRFFRIAPMYYFGIALYLALFGWGPRYEAAEGIRAADVVANLTFTHGFRENAINSVVPGGWSIAAEMIFYVLFPLCLYLAQRTPKVLLPMLGLSLFLALTYLPNVFGVYHLGRMSAFYAVNYLPCFVLGITTGLIITDGLENVRPVYRFFLPTVNSRFQLLDGSLLICLVILAPIFTQFVSFWFGRDIALPTIIVLTAIISALLCIRLHGEDRASVIIVNPLTRRLGLVSFSMYIIHFAILSPAYHFTATIARDRGDAFFAIYFIVLTASTFAVANITFQLIERPFIRVSHWLASMSLTTILSQIARRYKFARDLAPDKERS